MLSVWAFEKDTHGFSASCVTFWLCDFWQARYFLNHHYSYLLNQNNNITFLTEAFFG